MLYPCITDTLSFTPSGTIAAFATLQTFTARIKQEKKRLEAIMVVVTVATHGAGQPTATVGDGAPGLIRAIRLRATDVLGTRDIINVSGPGLLSFVKNNFGFLDRNTMQWYRTYAADVQATAATMCFYIPIRHPMIAEPYGNLLSLPLSSAFVKDDPILEVETNTLASVFTTTGTPAGTISAIAILRDIPDSVPYIPSELRTETLNADAAAARKTFEFGSVGFLTQCLVQGYSAQTYAPAVTRITPLTAGGLVSVEYGRNTLRKFNDAFIYGLNDLSQFNIIGAAADNLTLRALAGEYFLDFLSDHPGSDAFSAASVLNLNTEALGGDKCRLVIDTMIANYQARITTHKLLARTVDAIKPLMVSI